MVTAELSVDEELHVDIDRPMADVFDGVIEQFTEKMKYPDGRSMNFKLEAWPGGRWFRDLGSNSGHLWAHVQVIKPPTVLELTGPMFMSYAVVNHIEVKLSENDGTTRVTLHHRAIGPVEEQARAGMAEGWRQMMDELKRDAEK